MDISAEITGLIDEIRDNRTDGASELARQAAGVLKSAAEHSRAKNAEEFILEQARIGKELTSTRPAMAPIYNIVSRILGVIDSKNRSIEMDAVRQLLISRVDEVIKESLKAVEQIAKNSSRLIADGDTIMTHSYSSTVVAALKVISEKYADIEVIITRSGPGRAGERTARELGDRIITLTFINDTGGRPPRRKSPK